uniref:Ankyrin repeats (3 copies) n=1 Tax=Candidatus Berkiella aquae TaxID=295108 RepID=A0A0Q9YY83_9GAMM
MISGANKATNTLKFLGIIQKYTPNESTTVLRSLILDGIHIENKDGLGMTPLHWALFRSNPDIVELLLDNTAKIDATDDIYHTPLHLAAKENKYEIAELLLRNKANMEARSICGQTPLHWAAIIKNPKMIQLFINYKANIEATNIRGHTTLHLAVAVSDNLEAIRLLLDNNADIQAEDKNGNTPLKLALEHTVRFENFLSIILDKIAAVGRFDCLQEDFYINFLEKTLKKNNDDKGWQSQLAAAAEVESIDTPENMIAKILTYTPEQQCRIIKIIEQQYVNAMLMAKSLIGGILLPNIDDNTRLSSIEEGLKVLSISAASSSSLAEDTVVPFPTLLLSGNHQANEAAAALDDNEYSSDDELTSGISKSVRR